MPLRKGGEGRTLYLALWSSNHHATRLEQRTTGGYSLLLKTRETVFHREHHGTVPLSGSSLISMFMTLHPSGKGRYIKGQKSFLNGKSHKHCRGFHMSFAGDGSFDLPQSRNFKEKGVYGSAPIWLWWASLESSGVSPWTKMLALACGELLCFVLRMKNKMYHRTRQKQLEKPCCLNTHYRVNTKHQAEPVPLVPQTHPILFLPMTYSEATGIQAQS